MLRKQIQERENYEEKLEAIGFNFHTPDGVKYWNESAYLQLTTNEIDLIDDVTLDLHQMCLQGVQHVIDNNLFDKLKINPKLVPFIKESWASNKNSIIGRMDLTFKDGVPKLMEYNADTPASLIETAWAQWEWKEDKFPEAEQFNMLYENLSEAIKVFDKKKTVHLTGFLEILEDFENIQYIEGLLRMQGYETVMIDLKDIGTFEGKIYDLDDNEITQLYKLYPWEQLVEDSAFDCLKDVFVMEPCWKAIISNKAFMCILWELFPDHQNLIPSYFENQFEDNYVKKPIYSREGANVEIYSEGTVFKSDDLGYGEEGYIYQEFIPLPKFDEKYLMIGSWVINGIPSGIGIREDFCVVTKNEAMFIPHIFRN